TIYSRGSVKAAARRMRPFMLDESATDAHSDMAQVIENLLKTRAARGVRAPEDADVEDASRDEDALEADSGKKLLGYNDNVTHAGTVFHVQTEAQDGAGGFVETIIYQGGRVLFSKRTLLKDVAEEAAAAGLKEFAARQHRAAIAAIKTNRISAQG
ncbi:MAG TPA: hypothetical protein VII64_00385, partial [Thermodesulfobacteriota bacterium]